MYIFYIHSHITYVLSQLIAKEYNMAHEDIRYITSRNYKINNSTIKALDITPLYDYLENSSKIVKLFEIKKKIKELDFEIRKLSDESPARFYLPQFNHSLFQILGTNRMCKELVMVEEGITSYKRDHSFYNHKRHIFSIVLLNVFTKRFLLKNGHYAPFPKAKFKYAICIDKDCFPYIEDKKILQINAESFSNYKTTIASNSIVFVLDSFKEQTKISEEEYLNTIKETLSFVRHHKKVYIKFHPAQSESTRKKTIIYIKEKFEYESIICLPDDCLLEVEFIRLENLTVLGMHTSLLHYAKRFGHNVFSSIKTTSKNPKINKYIDHIMDKHQKNEYLGYE